MNCTEHIRQFKAVPCENNRGPKFPSMFRRTFFIRPRTERHYGMEWTYISIGWHVWRECTIKKAELRGAILKVVLSLIYNQWIVFRNGFIYSCLVLWKIILQMAIWPKVDEQEAAGNGRTHPLRWWISLILLSRSADLLTRSICLSHGLNCANVTSKIS